MGNAKVEQRSVCEIAATYFHVATVTPEVTLQNARSYLYENASTWAEKFFGHSVFTEVLVSEGSVIGHISVRGEAVFSLLAENFSFRHGVSRLVSDSKAFSSHVIGQFKANYCIEDTAVIRAERRLGIPGKMQRFFDRLDRLTYNKLKHRDREAEIKLLREEFQKIVELLNDEKDRLLFEEAVNQEAQVTPEPPALPDNLPADWPDPVLPRSYQNFVARITGPEKRGRKD